MTSKNQPLSCRKCAAQLPAGSAYCCFCGAAQTPRPKGVKRRGNGEGTAVKRGSTYTAIYTYYAGGRRITRTKGGFARKKDALAYIPTLKGAKAKGTVTLQKLYEPYSTSALLKLSASKQTAYRIAWGKLEAIAHRDITQLTIGDLQQAIDQNASTYYPARDMKTLLSHLYKRACAQGDAPSNLAAFIELPKLEESQPMPFTKEEVAALWQDYAKGHTFTGYILLMIYSGMMPGELIKAEKSMIDWERQVIVGAGLKTKKRKTTPIVLADAILPVLADLCRFSSTDKLLSMKRNDFYSAFDETLRRCGCRDLTPYACRHTTGTDLALNAANIPPSVIQEVMRHSRFTTTQRYIHPDTDDTLSAVNSL